MDTHASLITLPIARPPSAIKHH